MTRKPDVSMIFAAALLAATATSAFAQARAPAAQSPAPRAGAPSQPQAQPAQSSRPATALGETAGKANFAIKGDEVIARVGTDDVTADEVRSALAVLDVRQRLALGRDPALLNQTVRVLLSNRLVLGEALAKKWEQQPAVAAQLARARENLIVELYLQSVSTPPANYPSEAEVKSVYETNVSSFMVPRRFQLAQILIAVPKDADKAAESAARRKLDAVMKKVRQAGADFGAIARSDSDDAPSAGRGGEIGWIAEADLRPEIRTQVAGLAKSAVTDPVRVDSGWVVVKLLDTEASHTRPLSEVKDALVQRMRAERVEANRRAYVADLLKQSPPVINELALSRVLDAAGAPAQPAAPAR